MENENVNFEELQEKIKMKESVNEIINTLSSGCHDLIFSDLSENKIDTDINRVISEGENILNKIINEDTKPLITKIYKNLEEIILLQTIYYVEDNIHKLEIECDGIGYYDIIISEIAKQVTQLTSIVDVDYKDIIILEYACAKLKVKEKIDAIVGKYIDEIENTKFKLVKLAKSIKILSNKRYKTIKQLLKDDKYIKTLYKNMLDSYKRDLSIKRKFCVGV